MGQGAPGSAVCTWSREGPFYWRPSSDKWRDMGTAISLRPSISSTQVPRGACRTRATLMNSTFLLSVLSHLVYFGLQRDLSSRAMALIRMRWHNIRDKMIKCRNTLPRQVCQLISQRRINSSQKSRPVFKSSRQYPAG